MHFRRLFSSRPADGEDTADRPHAPATSGARSLTDAANAATLEQIRAFIVDHHLPLDLRTLTFAHAAFTGADPLLARKLTARLAAGKPVTAGWIDRVMPPDPLAESIEHMAGRLEAAIEEYASSARSARHNAASYSSDLERTVADGHEQGAAVHDILLLAGAMLDRTRVLESEMKRRETEAQHLKRSLARARRDADLDHLTGLPNRRAFDQILEVSRREATQRIEPLSVAFCDIDNFKRINDRHGHETGDRVIRAIAEALGRLGNARCHVARHGGEEFVLLFRGLSKAEARDRLDAVRANFAERRFVNRVNDEPIGQVTFSGGVADAFAYPTVSDALRAADEALYKAKAQGRNCIVMAT